MNITENIRIALFSIFAHKMRSLLTMLGIIIGISSVIAIVSIGQGGDRMLKSQFTGNENIIDIYYQPTDEEIQSNPDIWKKSFFTEESIESLQDIDNVEEVITSFSSLEKVFYREEGVEATVHGINQTYSQINSMDLSAGQFFLDSDFISANRVAFITNTLNKQLFNGDGVGKVIQVNAQPIEIIGVLKDSEGLFSLGLSELYIPANTWRNLYGLAEINEVSLQVSNIDYIESVSDAAINQLNRLHNTTNFQVVNIEEMSRGISQITGIMTAIIAGIASISLFVGGIGVMNIMLVSVTERTKEIGIRKSLGATKTQILVQFLIEAVVIAFIGGIIGTILGIGISLIASLMLGWPFLISIHAVWIGLLFSVGTGIFFGVLPARKASNLQPAEAFNYE